MRILLGMLLSLCVVSGFATEKTVLNFSHWQTKNGMTVYFSPAPSLSMLSLNLVFDAGSSRDKNNYGLSNFVASLIGEGAAGLNANQIANDFTSVGAEFNNSVDRDKVTFSLQTLTQKKYFNKAINTFVQVVSTPTFSVTAMNRIKSQLQTALQLQKQSPNAVAINATYKALYGNGPYGHSVIGTDKTVGYFKRQQVQDFYKKYYVANNADLIMVGNLSLSGAKALANKIAGSFPAGKAALPLIGIARVDKSRVIHINFPAKQTTVLIASPGIAYHDGTFFPLFVGNYVLGGSSLSSILNDQMREKRGLVYAVSSMFKRMALKGPFYIWFQTKSDQTADATNLARETLARFMSKDMSATRLAIAKKSIEGSFPLAFASNQGILSILTNMAFYHLSDHYLNSFRANINAVTAQSIKTAFNNTVSLHSLVTIEVGPDGKSESKLRKT